MGLVMQIFVNVSGATRTVEVDQTQLVETLKQRIEELEGIPADYQRLTCGTLTLVDGQSLSELEQESTVSVTLAIDGGRKKKKKKTYTKPKKIKHKHKKVKLAVLKYYRVDPRTQKIQRLKRECTSPELDQVFSWPVTMTDNIVENAISLTCSRVMTPQRKNKKKPPPFFLTKQKKKKKKKKKKS